MSYTIGVAGKGGTGKTTLASVVIRYLAKQKNGPVLAIDADPNSNLGEMLGLKAEETMVGIIDDISANIDKIPSGVTKERLIETRVQQSLGEGEGFDLLVMGRPEGPGCYCYVNNVLRNIVGKLIKEYDYVVIDNEAGLEHLSRRTSREADALIVVSDATAAGMRTANRLYDLVKELKIKTKKNFLVINRSKIKPGGLTPGLDYLGNIAQDKDIENFSLNGHSLLDLKDNSQALQAVRILGDRIWH